MQPETTVSFIMLWSVISYNLPESTVYIFLTCTMIFIMLLGVSNLLISL